MKYDRELTAQNVQDLSTADAITAFFAGLGYNTDVRTQQTPANLGIVADGILRPIKRIELIADQDGLLQVYLFELKTVTVTQARNLAQVFKNRSGNYLLVLTSDYERIDFVLIEKFVPQKATPSKGIGQPHIGVRPRMLTVDRRKPANIHLRVLRRFSYTESDPIAQYDKLVSAFAIADWSEEHFNNRALFSDHYLINRLPNDPVSWPEWRLDSKPAYRALNDLYREVGSTIASRGEKALRTELIEPCVNTLGFTAKANNKPSNGTVEADYLLCSSDKDNKPLAYCLVYPWMRYLDGKDDTRDNARPDDNPGQKVVSLLEQDSIAWAIVTNGKIWRLYSQKTHAKATNYYEIDLDEILSQDAQHAGGPGEPFRYFWLIFRRQAFELAPTQVKGETKQLSFLDRLLNESEEYAKELGERLKERVFEEVFPLISDGFIEYIKDRDGVNADLSQEALDQVFLGTLTLLYRLLFLLYAEARDLLPVKEVRGYYEASLTKLKNDIAEIAGTIEDEVEPKLRKQHKDTEYSLYDRLNRLFKVIDIGDDSLNVPLYNGGLFITGPNKDDQTPEARNARFLIANKVPDRFLARAIDLLARGIDPKRHDLVPVDYKSLGVRQLGSIYEGLLEFKLRLAETKMAIVKGKKTEEVVPYSDAVKNKLKILTIGRGKDAKERIYKKGDVYLENDKKERKATGSYYTPDHIVKYIVEHAVGPVLEEKFEAMRPKLRQAQLQRKAWIDRQKAMTKPNPESQLDSIMPELADELFDIKVLDPAMGSGHFLVEAVDFITDKALTFLMAFPWNPIIQRLERTRREILDEMDRQGINIDPKRLDDIHLLKRHVLKRCIYGVDLNPMAVELAKVSLWLDCFTLGAPLSFLDHHLKCGNSLIGVTVEEVDKAITSEGAAIGLFSKPLQSIKASLKTMLDIGDLPDVTPQQVVQSRNLYNSALSKTQSLKRLLDVYTSGWFSNFPQNIAGKQDAISRYRNTEKPKEGEFTGKGKKKSTIRDISLEFLNSDASLPYRDAIDETQLKKAIAKLPAEYRKMVENSEQDAEAKRFFHWEMEYPEVFYKVKGDTVDRVAGAGFDAVVGNPPYDVIVETVFDEKSVARGTGNLFGHFIAKALNLVRTAGSFSFVVPLSFSCGATYEQLRQAVFSTFGELTSSHFSIRPAKLFPNVDQRITIFAATGKSGSGCRVSSTRLYRFHDGQQEALVLNPEMGEAGLLKHGFIPRVANKTGAQIYHKFISIPTVVAAFMKPTGLKSHVWWYHGVGRYWHKAYDFLPLFKRDGENGVSTNIKEVSSSSKAAQLASIAAINSSLFYFWWIIQSDEFHVLPCEVGTMPVPESLLKDSNVAPAVDELMEDYRKHAVRKTLNVGGCEVEMDEIHARHSRPFILKIDEILAPHYGLDSRELKFLQEYDIGFRLGEE